MSSVNEIMDWLEKMVSSEAKVSVSTTTDDLRQSTKRSFSERTSLIHSLAEETGFNMDASKSQTEDVCESYLSTLYTLLNELNSIIEQQTKQFTLKEATDPPRAKKTEHTAPRLSPDVLSVGHQAVLAKVFQFIVTLGIVPHLATGVGVPVTARSKFGNVISSLVKSNCTQLQHNVSKLLPVIQPANIRAVFMAKHLGDLLAALIQLQHTQVTNPTTQHTTESPADFTLQLESVISKSYQPLIVRELLVLQSAAGAKTPTWMRATCARYLTRVMLSADGVKYIIAGMITSDTDSWQKFEMVGRVIATPPKQWTADDYYLLIAPQVLALLNESDEVIARQYGRVCATVLSSVGVKQPALMESLFWRPLTSDLLSKCTDKQGKCLQAVYRVICCAAEPQSILLTHCMHILPDIFSVYVRETSGIVVSDTRLCCEELLAACMSYSDEKTTSLFLHKITFSTTSFTAGVTELSAEEFRTAAILYCVKKVKESAVVEKYFVALLQKLTSVLSEKNQSDQTMELSPLILRFRVMSLLAALCDTHSSVCLQHPHYIVSFVQSTLEHFLSMSSQAAYSDTDTLSLSLGLLTALMSGAKDVKLSEADVLDLKQLNEPLNKLSLLASVPAETRELALNIRVAIATQGLVWMDKLSQSNKRMSKPSNAKSGQSERFGIEVLPSDNTSSTKEGSISDVGAEATCCPQLSQASVEKAEKETTSRDNVEQAATSGSSYREALLELSDHLIPVKGHALIQLSKYIQRRDKETLDNRVQLQKLLIEHLSHSDSYIYLSAIAALTALADVHPAEVLPALCDQYRNYNIADETRLKVGEVMTKGTRLLGDFAPSYSDVILPTILIGCKSKDDLLRASSLVNLGELCKLLQYTIGNHVHEIVECLSSSLVDRCQSSRKGAAYSISLIVCELNNRCFDILGADSVKTLYKALKSCLNADNDDVTVRHCAAAVEAIDKVTKQLFSSDSSKLEKRIFVLDPPS